MKRYNHIPKHLRPPVIPKLRKLEPRNKLPTILKRQLFMILGFMLFPILGISGDEEEDEYEDEDDY
jgi:hypothetical protein